MNIEEINRRFNEQVEYVEKGLSVGKINLGKPGLILQSTGIRVTDMFIREAVLRPHMKKHGLKAKDIFNLPRAIQNPLMVYEWGEKAKSRIVITELERASQRITIAIKLERGGKQMEVNEIASIHGKDLPRLIAEMNTKITDFGKDNLKYVDKKRIAVWMNLTSPKEADVQTKQQLYVATKIIQDFNNPKLPEKKIIKKTQVVPNYKKGRGI